MTVFRNYPTYWGLTDLFRLLLILFTVLASIWMVSRAIESHGYEASVDAQYKAYLLQQQVIREQRFPKDTGADAGITR